jgi:hypothetical protein
VVAYNENFPRTFKDKEAHKNDKKKTEENASNHKNKESNASKQ